MITRSFELATDGEFRLLAGFTSPPRAGVVTGILPSGQVTVTLDEAGGGEARAWPLNGWDYPVGAVVYVAFAADSPESGIILGAKAPVPAHAAFVGRDGGGRAIVVSVTAIGSTTPRVLIADGAGDVVYGVTFQGVVSDGATGVGASGTLTPNTTQDVVAGTLTLRLTCTASGALTAHRQSGTGSASVVLLAVWL